MSQGLFSRETVAIDGSKFRANNSRRNIFTRDNVGKDLADIEEKLNAKVAEYLEQTAQKAAYQCLISAQAASFRPINMEIYFRNHS